jgi:hypothetical protein
LHRRSQDARIDVPARRNRPVDEICIERPERLELRRRCRRYRLAHGLEAARDPHRLELLERHRVKRLEHPSTPLGGHRRRIRLLGRADDQFGEPQFFCKPRPLRRRYRLRGAGRGRCRRVGCIGYRDGRIDGRDRTCRDECGQRDGQGHSMHELLFRLNVKAASIRPVA